MQYRDTSWPPKCDALVYESYTVTWHVVSLFVVLGSSLLGILLPILGKRVPSFHVPDYAFAIGKSVTTGVVLGVALIHMLMPANKFLMSECLPVAVRNPSNPLAYIICLVSIAVMHCLEACLRVLFEGHGASVNPPIASEESNLLLPHTQVGGCHFHVSASTLKSTEDCDKMAVLSVALMEFGISLHNLFVGLTVGVCDDSELYTLISALSLHQFFEGVALGSRLVSAALPLHVEYMFAVTFVLSAPFGAAIGIMGVYEDVINVRGKSYLLIQGVAESVCAGMLLYLGFQLLLNDFNADLRCNINNVRSPRGFLLTMLAGLWVGISTMAMVGQYL